MAAGTSAKVVQVFRQGPRQNWILDPLQDTFFILAAPLIALGIALLMFRALTPADAITRIGVAYVVFTVAHHVPTFLRIYGDTDLFRRYKWSFLLGPVIPFTFSLGVLAHLIHNGSALENFFSLFIILSLWDPWHFLMQHYGFMRIYDRPNAAPRQLAARMDLVLCSAWFVFIMLAGGDWLPTLLFDLQTRARIPLVFALPRGLLPMATKAAAVIAVTTTVVYLAYLIDCWRKDYFVSPAKIALTVITFGVMYVAYTPNALILSLAPAWTFKVGFAVLGIVHVTQYLAIVWRYNRSLAVHSKRARPGLFQMLHRRGGFLIGSAYVMVCVLYGEALTTVQANQWIMAILLAAGFTSTLMHYYFDGFIWKIRHSQNREHLVGDKAYGENSDSWWSSHRRLAPPAILLRQALYFAVPMTLLTAGAYVTWKQPEPHYTEYVRNVQSLNLKGSRDEMLHEAQASLVAMNRQLPLIRTIAELQPNAANRASLAFLLYTRSQYEHRIIPALTEKPSSPDSAMIHQRNVQEAIQTLKEALAGGGSLAHTGRERLDRETAQQILGRWQREFSATD